MTTVIFLTFRTFFITIMTVGMMASLSEFRFAPRKLLCILAIYSAWVFGSSALLLRLGGELLLLRAFFFTISIPATILIYWTANDTPAQAVFNYTTQIMVSALSASLIRWITELFRLSQWANMLLMGLFYFAVIYLEWRFLRRPFRMLMQAIPTRWGVLTLIPCVFCAYLIFVSSWPGSYLENASQRMYLYAAIFPIAVVYISVFKSLIGQYRVQMEQQRAVLLTMQISALKEKLQKIEEVEEGIRIQRHDLRHRLQVAGELVARGSGSRQWIFSVPPWTAWTAIKRFIGAIRRFWMRCLLPILTKPDVRKSRWMQRSLCRISSRWRRGSWPLFSPTPWKTQSMQIWNCPGNSGGSAAGSLDLPTSCWRLPTLFLLLWGLMKWGSLLQGRRDTGWELNPSASSAKNMERSVSTKRRMGCSLCGLSYRLSGVAGRTSAQVTILNLWIPSKKDQVSNRCIWL